MSTKQILVTLIAVLVLGPVGLLVAGSEGQIQSAADLSSIAGWKGVEPKSTEAFSFAVVSDRTGGHVEGEWAAAVEQINLLRPDFVISVGDLIEGFAEDEVGLIEQWEEFEAIAEKFKAPFFYCPGNHDVYTEEMLAMYRRRHGVEGKTYYSFDYRGCHFVVLNSVTAVNKASFAEEQLAWLAKDLAGAKDSKHNFIFYHFPRFLDEQLWQRVREMLPEGKTTIFNGHRHRVGFVGDDKIPGYMVAATAAGVRESAFRMFAYVSVDQGEPTVTFVPLHKILPSGYAQFADDVGLMLRSRTTVLGQDKVFTFEQQNPLVVPVRIKFHWEAQKWTIEPAADEVEIKPGGVVKRSFSLAAKPGPHNNPILWASYNYLDPYRKEIVEMKQKFVVAACEPFAIPRVEKIVVDGQLNDWLAIQRLHVVEEGRIHRGMDNWSGPADTSFDMLVASDGERLFLAFDITDDQINIDGPNPWINDALEIFWDARSPDQRDSHNPPGTGQLVLVPPEIGSKPQPHWYHVQSEPEDLIAECKRRDGGYVYELSIPLSQLGVQTPPVSGQKIRLELVLNDRDLVDGRTTMTIMTTSGLRGNRESAGSYVWMFK